MTRYRIILQTELESTHKILLYAPGTTEGFNGMTEILDELQIDWKDNVPTSWRLMPMESKVDLQSSDLGDLLEHALHRTREHLSADGGGGGSVVFLGMDSPSLPLDEIMKGLGLATTNSRETMCNDTRAALLCPASDGGYGMLSVPAHADSAKIFQGIPWSHPLTAIAQVKAFTDQDIPVCIGTLMHDIDEPQDVKDMCERLRHDKETMTTKTRLDEPSGWSCETKRIKSHHPTLFHTRKALLMAGLLQAEDECC